MRRIVGIVLCGFLVSTALSGQQASAPKKNASSVPGADKKEIEALRLKIALLEGEIAGLEKRIGQIEQTGLQNYVDIAVLKREEATFDPSSPGTYRTVNTDVGPLLVALGKVEQYLDGYKVSLEICNPLSVTLSGFEVEAAWDPGSIPGRRCEVGYGETEQEDLIDASVGTRQMVSIRHHSPRDGATRIRVYESEDHRQHLVPRQDPITPELACLLRKGQRQGRGCAGARGETRSVLLLVLEMDPRELKFV